VSFQIRGLPASQFTHLFGLSDEELAKHDAIRKVADRMPGFPCRVSLRDAELGEPVLLLNYEHLPVANPYRSRYAIYVRENAPDTQLEMNEIPEVLRTRLLSVRAFDEAGMLIEAEVLQGTELAAAVDRMFARKDIAFLHAHNAKPGCFAARIDRA
jgi:Protein of unknown function (DUF1203)